MEAAPGPALARLRAALQQRWNPTILGALRLVGRATTHATYVLETSGASCVLKVAAAGHADVLESEAQGLQALAATQALAVPRCLDRGEVAGRAFLALEWIDFVPASPAAHAALGHALAALHRHTGPRFGLARDNWIGAARQLNGWHTDWPEFWRTRRLAPQLERARLQGLPRELLHQGHQLLATLPTLLDDHAPAASLLHGDLWAGNWGVCREGRPYVFDPAVYYGDRETDLAMTRLFGGFGPEFYAAYVSAWPLADGWERRVDLYTLYHLLNHFVLFGAGYTDAVAAALRRVLSP